MSNIILKACISCIRFNNVAYNNLKHFSIKKLPIISCKRKELNFYGQNYKKLEEIPLASNGWNHKKSRGDYFVLYGNAISNMKTADLSTSETSFSDMELCPDIVNALSLENFTKPTEIQSKSFPVLLSGRNALITAQTGCGKTLAYLLPILQQILKLKATEGEQSFNSPAAIIITPSRELAIQLNTVAESLCKHLSITTKCIVGGSIKHKMINTPFEQVDLMFASLGALSKLVTVGVYNIARVHHIVLDEADTLLDDSFIEKLSHFLKKFPFHYQVMDPAKGVQLTLVSATMPSEFSEIMSQFIDTSSFAKIATKDLHKALSHVPQRFVRLGPAQKPLELLKLVRADVNKNHPVMIFSNRTVTSDWVSMFLNENNIKCINLNGSMLLAIKEGKLELFMKGKVNVISCTDIIARGLDTITTRHVINYDFPHYTADYIHRCGRTGRIGSSSDCLVTNFISTERQVYLVQKMEMSFRKMEELPKVDGNISKIIKNRITGNIDKLEKQVSALKST